MKKMKRLAALFLAVVMVMAMGMTAFAEPGDDQNNATITINNAVKGEKYTLYKLFDVTVAKNEDGEAVGYSYFLNKGDYGTYGATLEAAGVSFTKSADENRYTVSKINNKDLSDLVSSDMAAFASKLNEMMKGKDAAKYRFNNLTSKEPVVNEVGDPAEEVVQPVVFDNLAAGYYFVDSSLGSLCSLNTSADSAQIFEKNSIPSITKKVQEDSTSEWTDEATADLLQTVNFQLTVNTGTNTAPEVPAGETGVDANYIITDVLPDGMTYTKINDITGIAQDKATVDWVEATRTLTIVLDHAAVEALGQDANIVIEYSATLDSSTATIGTAGNKNTVTLTYQNQSVSDEATVKTYEVGGKDENGDGTLTKVDATNGNAPLAGVEFTLVNASKQYATVAQGTDKFAGWSATKTVIKTNSDGELHVEGLDAGTYTLTETKPLDGYNALDHTIKVTIADDGTVTYLASNAEEGTTPSTQMEIQNSTGAILPSTGGIGTTIFYVVGGILVLGAGVLLITKKRMSAK